MFRRHNSAPRSAALASARALSSSAERLADFSYLDERDIYLDAACQSLRPAPVIHSLTSYYETYNACGGRVKYAWGKRVDEDVAATRAAVLAMLGLSVRTHAVSFTLNTTYGINLLLHQMPRNRYSRIITSHVEHNSVFLPTITAAQRLGIDRIVLDRDDSGALCYTPAELDGALVVVSASSNIDGLPLSNLAELVRDAHSRGGTVIVDAAQTMAHGRELLNRTAADALCFSAHKMYGASLGVIVTTTELLASLEISFVGGGMVSAVRESSYDLVRGDPGALLEPGLQAWGEIIALGEAIRWLEAIKPGGYSPATHLDHLSHRLFDGLAEIPGLTLLNSAASPVISMYAPGQDSHRLAVFLARSGIMARSGYFCAHHYLKDQRALPPLLRFSLGLHSTESDVDHTTAALSRLLKGLL